MLEQTITSSYLIVDFDIKLSTPRTSNADECFPNYSKMEHQKEKVPNGGFGVGADFMS